MAKPTLPPVAEDNNDAIDVDHTNEEPVEQAESVREERINKKKRKWNSCKCFCDFFNFCFGVEDGYEPEEIEIHGVYVNDNPSTHSSHGNYHDNIGRNESHVSLAHEAHHHVDTHHSSSNDHCISNDFGNSTCDYGGADSGGGDCGGGDCGGGTD